MMSSTSDAAERSLMDDVKNLLEDGRTLIEAELEFQKSRAGLLGHAAKSVASWAALFLALVFFALMALTFGSVLTLAPLIGPLAATALVTLALLILAALSALMAKRRWRKTADVIKQPYDV